MKEYTSSKEDTLTLGGLLFFLGCQCSVFKEGASLVNPAKFKQVLPYVKCFAETFE